MILTKPIRVLYKNVLKPFYFKLDPEFVHDRMIFAGRILGSNIITKSLVSILFNYENKMLEQEVCGIRFRNPVGLSAGFDKDANLVSILPSVGFGFMEVGSVTLNSYEGNPKPRLVRLKKSKGLIVNYGLKNIGVDKIISKLQNSKSKNRDFKIAISIAKTNSKETVDPNLGVLDYYECQKMLLESNSGDFYVINISCPNAFGGEPFTTSERLNMLLEKLMSLDISKPIFVKMPINLLWEDFKKLLEVIVKYNIQGVVIGNLTKVRDPNLIKDEILENTKGGISGKPTEDLCNNLISKTRKAYKDRLVIIGVGGIFSAQDAYEKIKRGASLVELITGMIFEGPQLIGEINKGLVELLKKDGFNNIQEAIGINSASAY